MIVLFRRAREVAVLAAVATMGVAACGGSNPSHVASLGNSSGGTPADSTTTLPKGNPTQLLDEWGSCMRSHGVPDLADPTITSSGAIHIVLPADANANGQQGLDPHGGPCGPYLEAAQKDLSGGKPVQKPDPAKLLKFSQCMQSHGFPQFPDPGPHGLSLRITPGSPMNPGNPAFLHESTVCGKKAGTPAFGNPADAPAGSIQVQSGFGPAGGPGGNGGSGAVIGNQGAGSGSSGLGTNNASTGG
jgi:hypothetical protein